MFSRILRPLRRRRAFRALAAYSEAKDAYRRAKVRGDSRAMGQAQSLLTAATNDLLRAELAMGR